MKNIKEERRRSLRYDTGMKVLYEVVYEVKTRVAYRVYHPDRHKLILKKYSGVSRDVSVNGLCFTTKKNLEEGDVLFLEVFAPNAKKPIHMTGEVRWMRKLPAGIKTGSGFRIGIELISVENKSVKDSIHQDKRYKVDWSIVLDSLFGNFKSMVKTLKKNLRHTYN